MAAMFVLMLVIIALNSVFYTKAMKEETVVVRCGSTVILSCQNDAILENGEKVWIFNNVTILYAGQQRFAPPDFANTRLDRRGSLLIDEVESQNEGWYICKIGSTQIISKYFVTIEVLPALRIVFSGEFMNHSDTCQISDAKSYQIECRAMGSSHDVTIRWAINNKTYTGREQLTRTTGTNNKINTESQVLYRPKTDDKEISCQATGQSNSSVMVRTLVSVCGETPQKPVSISVTYGNNITLMCESPTMMSMWKFPVIDNTRSLNDGEIININNVRIENEGEYKCYKAGQKTEITNLTVQVIPRISLLAVDEDGLYDNVTVFTNKLYKLYCNSKETRSPAIISWKINDKDYATGFKTSNRPSETDMYTYDYQSSIYLIPSSVYKLVSCFVTDVPSGLEWRKSLFIETFEGSPELRYNISLDYGSNESICCDFKQNDHLLWQFHRGADRPITPTLLENIKEYRQTSVNGSGSSCLYIESVKITYRGRYMCYKFDESSIMFELDVIVNPHIEVTFGNNLGSENITVYGFKVYHLQCQVSGAFPPVKISWEVNGVATVHDVYYENLQHNTNATDLFDSSSVLYYRPRKNDANISCLVISDKLHREVLVHLDDVITFEAVVETKRLLQGSNVTLRCNYTGAVERLYWLFEGIKITCVAKRCNLSGIIGILSARNETIISIINLNAVNEGKYSCYHGLEEIKTIHVEMEVKLRVYLMPGIKRPFPGTVELYEGSKYTLECMANSTDDIKSVKWKVNGVEVSDELTTTTDDSSLKIKQVISQYHYTSVISHVTISCTAESENGTIVTETARIHLVLTFLKKVMLTGGVSLFLLILATCLLLICRLCSNCAKRKMVLDHSFELREIEFHNVDTAAWRMAMNDFGERSTSHYGLIRRSRVLTEKSKRDSNETGGRYERFIMKSFQGRVVPFSRLSFVVQLKSGTFKDRWMGKIRQRSMVKMGTFITSVSENASEEEKFRWDIFVKNVIDIPFSEHVARVVGVSMHYGRLHLLQEFLTVEILKTYIQSNSKFLTSGRQVSRNVFCIASGVVEGMEFLAQNKFCHPALCISKILIGNNDECKLYDFCLIEDALGKIQSIKEKKKPYFSNLAKETILLGEYTNSSDVWSTGTALWEIFSLGDVPFEGLDQEQIRRIIKRGTLLSQPALCSRQIYDVMLDCWVDRTERPSLSAIRERLTTAINKHMQEADVSRVQAAAAYVPSSTEYTSTKNTYGFSAYSCKAPEENIYEKMEGSL